MGRRETGITGLLQVLSNGRRVELRRQKLGTPESWTGIVTANFMKEARPMFSGAISTHEFASKLLKAGRLQLLDIAAFYANQEIIHLKDLYPGNDVYTAFLIRRDRELKLLTIGSKTVTEIKAAGYSFKKSQVPFLASVTLNEHGRRVATSVNLQIHPSHIPNLTKRRVYADQQDSEWGSGEESESPDVP